jgi:hypothetical protein
MIASRHEQDLFHLQQSQSHCLGYYASQLGVRPSSNNLSRREWESWTSCTGGAAMVTQAMADPLDARSHSTVRSQLRVLEEKVTSATKPSNFLTSISIVSSSCHSSIGAEASR